MQKSQFQQSVISKLFHDESMADTLVYALDNALVEEAENLKKKFDIATVSKLMSAGKQKKPLDIGTLLNKQNSNETLEPKATAQKVPNQVEEEIINPTEKKEKVKRKQKNKSALISSIGPGRIVDIKKGDSVTDIITKMFNLLKKDYDDRLKKQELENNFEQERKEEDERRHKEFLKALAGLKFTEDDAVVQNISNINESSTLGKLLDAFAAGAGASAGVKLLTKIGVFFASPAGAALLLGGATLIALLRDKNPKQTNKGLQTTLGGYTEEAKVIAESGEDVVERRKQKLIREAHKTGKIKGFDYSGKQAKKYLTDIGFDEKTGLTAEEKNSGYDFIDESGKPKMKIGPSLDSVPEEELKSPKFEVSKEFYPNTKGLEKQMESAGVNKEPAPVPKPLSPVISSIKENNDLTLKENTQTMKPVVIDNSKTMQIDKGGSNNSMGGDAPLIPEESTILSIISKLVRTV